MSTVRFPIELTQNLDDKNLLKQIKRTYRFRKFEIDTENHKVS